MYTQRLYLAIALLGASMLMPGMVGAQKVSLDSCRNMALRNNKMLKVASENINAASLRKKSAESAYLPGLDFNGGYMLSSQQIELLKADAKLPTMKFDPATMSYKYNILTDAEGVPVKDPQTGSYIPNEVAVIPKEAMSYNTHQVFFGAFTLTQPVFMGGQIRALNEISKYAEEVTRSTRDAVSQEVVYNVDEAYWRVVSLRSKKSLAEQYLSLMDSLRFNVNALLREGMATKSDVLSVEVKYNEAQIMLTKVDNGLSLSRMALSQICGLPVDTPLDPDESSELESNEMTPEYTYNMSDVYASRPDLATLRHGISLFESKEKLVMGDMLPKVALVGAYSFSNPNVNHGFSRSFGGAFSIGATVTVPLWHWGGRYNLYKASQAETAAARMLLSDMEEKVDLQVSQAKYSFQEAFKTYDMTLTNMRKADENLRQAQLAFREGMLTTDDVVAAQTAWLQAHSEMIDAQIGIRLCETYLSKVLGRL